MVGANDRNHLMKKGGLKLDTETTNTMETKEQTVPAIRSDSVVTYLSNLSAALNSITADLSMQIANINATMNKTDATNKENS
jgi:hypothetical protein